MMSLQMDFSLGMRYRNPRQRVRVATESWVGDNLYCPFCGATKICPYENNRPVADFFCSSCQEDFELKSRGTTLCHKLCDGAYDTMMERLKSSQNPNLILLRYSKESFMVRDLCLIPKRFFTPSVIEKREPLPDNTQRKGWIGCNILIGDIPRLGVIELIKNGVPVPIDSVIQRTRRAMLLNNVSLPARGWAFDVLRCIELIDQESFSIDDVYLFTDFLASKHPDNHNVQAKIRQQLQVLRNPWLNRISSSRTIPQS